MRAAFILLLVLGTFAPCCCAAAADEVWRVASLSWPPYADADMEGQGDSVKLLRRVLAEAGVTLVVDFYPWARAQEFARTRDYVGYFPAWPTEVGEGFIASLPVDYSVLAVMTPLGSPVRWDGLEALFREWSVGLVQTYVYPEEVERLARLWPEHVQRLPHEESLLRFLLRGRADAAITDPLVMAYFAHQLGLAEPRTLAGLGGAPLVVAFRDSPENKVRISLLNSRLRTSSRNRVQPFLFNTYISLQHFLPQQP